MRVRGVDMAVTDRAIMGAFLKGETMVSIAGRLEGQRLTWIISCRGHHEPPAHCERCEHSIEARLRRYLVRQRTR